MKIRIYTMTHKKFEVPSDKMYVPLQVGKAGKEDLGYLGDDMGEQISELNKYYSELTGFYWVWKNVSDLDYVGTCHYRRFLLNEQEKIMTESEYLSLLNEYDLITTKRVLLNNSYHFGFSANHNIHALDMTGEVIREIYPEYYDTFLTLVNGPETYFGNMIVTRKDLFDQYCQWLFTIFFEVQKRINLETDEDEYHKRVFGFISEFLLLVWTTVNGLKVYECKVGMLGEKAETREMKEQLAAFFHKKDIRGAKAFFMKRLKERPDVLMEASDITGELKLSMQIIATADQEWQINGKSILDDENEFKELTVLFSRINRTVTAFQKDNPAKEEEDFICQKIISDTAIKIAVMLQKIPQKEQEKLETRILQFRKKCL